MQTHAPSELRILTFNLRTGTCERGTPDAWKERRGDCIALMAGGGYDFIGAQEVQWRPEEPGCDQAGDLARGLAPAYGMLGRSREAKPDVGEGAPVFYRRDRWEPDADAQGTLWLSETPDKPSMGWDAACYRTATWALLQHKKSGRKFYYVNTHLDHVGQEARRKGLELIQERIASLNRDGLPVILGGDFNVTPEDPALEGLDARMKSARRFAVETDKGTTFHDWGRRKDVYPIDHIYFSGFSSCLLFEVVTKPYADRKFISDHYPVRAVLVF